MPTIRENFQTTTTGTRAIAPAVSSIGQLSDGVTGAAAGSTTGVTNVPFVPEPTLSSGITPRPTTLSGKIWSSFDPTDIVSEVKQTVTEAVWSTNTGSLTVFYTSSAQSASNGDYYYDVYHQNPASSTTAAVQFAIAYGNRNGSGSNDISESSNIPGLTPSRAIYSQYRNSLLDPTDESFTLANGKAADSAVFITFNRARYKERLDPGNWEVSLSGSNGSIITLRDDYTPTGNDTYSGAGAVYNIVSGSIGNGVYNTAAPVYFGKLYPDWGVMVLDGDVLRDSASIAISTASLADMNNHGKVFYAISGAAALSTPTSDLGFQVRSQQQITSTYYFVRIKNGEYNFSNNSTFVTGSDGTIRHPEMINDPRVYLTTIGLYDNANQLLAVAKLSRPLQKSFSREALIRVKLDF